MYIYIHIYIYHPSRSIGRSVSHNLSHDPSAGRPMFISIYIYVNVVRDDMSDGPATMWTGPKKANQGMPLAQH